MSIVSRSQRQGLSPPRPAAEADGLPTYDGPLRVAIAHDFLLAFGGAERVLAEMADAFPAADIWAFFVDDDVASTVTDRARVHMLLPEARVLTDHHRALTPLYPALVRACRIPDADVLLTSSYAFAHRLRTRNNAPQICFCHSPLRFAWTATEAYEDKWARRGATRLAFRAIAAAMRRGDRRAAQRVDRYLGCSEWVRDQIRRFYGIEPQMVTAPVNVDRFRPDGPPEDYFLLCGRLIEPYKRPTAVVDAFRLLPDSRLIVAGDGPEMDSLRDRAPSNVTFLGYVHDDVLVPLMQRCAATIFPSRDDFGLVPLEVNACGRPVLALAGGGALETVADGRSGTLFSEATPEAIAQAVRGFDPNRFDPAEVRAHASAWDRRKFRSELIEIVERAVPVTA
jgi:glycosyltransferase involved in cell wall biosynthesis